MSRIGNSPITIPDGVSVEISENKILVKGKLGEIEQEFFESDIESISATKIRADLRNKGKLKEWS